MLIFYDQAVSSCLKLNVDVQKEAINDLKTLESISEMKLSNPINDRKRDLRERRLVCTNDFTYQFYSKKQAASDQSYQINIYRHWDLALIINHQSIIFISVNLISSLPCLYTFVHQFYYLSNNKIYLNFFIAIWQINKRRKNTHWEKSIFLWHNINSSSLTLVTNMLCWRLSYIFKIVYALYI